MPGKNVVPVSFRVRASVHFGETVHVVGNVPVLGSWKVEYSIPLVTTPESYPIWESQDPIPLFKDSQIQYKYAVFSGGVFNRWEKSTDVRNLVVPGASFCVSDDIKTGDDDTPMTIDPDGEAETFLANRKNLDRCLKKRVSESMIDDDDGILLAMYFLPVKVSRRVAVVEHNYKNRAIPEETPPNNGSTMFPDVEPVESSSLDNIFHVEWDHNALLSRKTSSVADNMRIFYIGYPRCDFELKKSDYEGLQAALVPFRCIPVFLDAETHRLAYHVYCQDTLRQLFHHQVTVYGPLPTRWWHRSLHEAAWHAYCASNRAFAERIIEYVSENDIIWIHGYELLLLPSFLARRLQQVENVKVGLFIHSPFPSSEIFRTLSVREEILRGMLNADQIGFHLYEYARPFLSCCHRVLGIADHSDNLGEKGHLAVDYQGRKVLVTVCHAGIDASFVRSVMRSPRVSENAIKLLDAATLEPKQPVTKFQNHDQVIVVGIDYLDYLSGVHFKLKWYETFLANYPEWQDRMCCVQVCLEFGSSNSTQVRNEIRNMARRINAMYPRSPGRRPAVCLLEWESCSLIDRIALFSIADVFLETPLRAGLMLNVLEFYVVAGERRVFDGPWSDGLAWTCTSSKDQQIMELRKIPSLIISEFNAAFRILPSGIRVNPWRRVEIEEALQYALTMPAGERANRQSLALNYCETHNETGWAIVVLNDIKASSNRMERILECDDDGAPCKNSESFKFSGVGLGLSFRSIEFRKDFQHANNDLVALAYRRCKSRLILLDYGGTTVSDDNITDSIHGLQGAKFEFHYRPRGEAIPPSKDMQATLLSLVHDPANIVFIISGRNRHELEAAFSCVPGIGLSAEHGSYFSFPHAVSDSSAWKLQSTPMFSLGSDQEKYLSLKRTQRSNSTHAMDHASFQQSASTEKQGRHKHSGELTRPWISSGEHFDDAWMDICEQIMDIYTQRTNGTYIESKDSALVWQYRDAEPEFGEMQAKELKDHLSQMLKSFRVDVTSGKGYVEVGHQGVDKGHACSFILSTLWPDSSPEFIMCMGDDVQDEAMFEFCDTLNVQSEPMATISEQGTFSNKKNMPLTPTEDSETSQLAHSMCPSSIFSIVVGEKPSSAKYYVNDAEEVAALLDMLARVSNRSQGYMKSSMDIVEAPNSQDSSKKMKPIAEEIPPTSPIAKLTIKSLPMLRNPADEDENDSRDAAAAAVAASRSSLDLSRMVRSRNEPSESGMVKTLASSSMPLLSEYFSLDRSAPSSRNVHEYLDALAAEDGGIIF